ncbi:MAG: hypothetical protein ACRESX_02090 [Gammaproteobacteria bacterium]
MELIQEQHEREVGDAFITWLNTRGGTSFVFCRRGDEGPDLIYESDGKEIGVEVVGAYYDKSYATFQWQKVRQIPNKPKMWTGIDFDDSLRQNVEERIAEKCIKGYGSNCLLLIDVHPGLTPMPEMQELLYGVAFPSSVPFVGIYVAGGFPTAPHTHGGYYAWQLWPRDPVGGRR